MAVLTIRNLDDRVKRAIRIRAAANGRSMEEEARQALVRHFMQDGGAEPEEGLATRIARRFADAGGVDLEIPPRMIERDPPRFD
jgi:plasmid stability protein